MLILMFWWLLALVVAAIALKVFVVWFNSPKLKGTRGERLVARRLRNGLPGDYQIINDIY